MTDYRTALVFAGVFGIAATTAYLQWHYHRNVDAGVIAICLVALVGVGAAIRRGRQAGRK